MVYLNLRKKVDKTRAETGVFQVFIFFSGMQILFYISINFVIFCYCPDHQGTRISIGHLPRDVYYLQVSAGVHQCNLPMIKTA